jgi:proteic killer suppression protein
VDPHYATRIWKILALLETAENLEDMDLPGLDLHQLKGTRKGTWAVKITFKIQNKDVFDVNYEDYH